MQIVKWHERERSNKVLKLTGASVSSGTSWNELGDPRVTEVFECVDEGLTKLLQRGESMGGERRQSFSFSW